MSIKKPLIGFSIFALVSILVTVVVWNTLARTVAGDTRKYTAIFTDVLGLRSGDDVRMAGVRVGKIEKIELDDSNNAKVSFIVQADQAVYGNTKALVRYQNLIGQRYVALAPGKDGNTEQLRSGATIPLANTEPSFDVSALLNGFQPMFQALEPAQVNAMSESLIQALQGDGVSLSAFIIQAAQLATDFQRRDAILSDVIVNLSAVMTGLAQRGDQLETLVTQTRALIGGLYSQGQSLQNSVQGLSDNTTSLVNMLSALQPKLTATQDQVVSATNLLIINGERLDRAAIDLPAVAAGFGRVTSEGAYANSGFCRLDLTLYGVLFPRGIFSQIGGNKQSAVCR
ncbi:MCE family protein [Nocardia sp. NPDC058666]|uniref:MCE family protein n=1 Tax=unclassified Nocardia TaxID=2637762 RepID=UPI003661D9F5